MRETDGVADDGEEMSVWDPEPGNTLLLGLLGGGVWSGLVLLVDALRGWWSLAALLPGYAVILALCLFVTVPIQYTLTNTELVSRRRGKVEELPLAKITDIAGGYLPDVGPQIYVYGPSGGFATLNIGSPANTAFLHRLGLRMVDMGRDRAVIEDEKTRRALGLPGGGLRDPWTPPSSDGR